MGNKRLQIEPVCIDQVLKDLNLKLTCRLRQKDYGTFAGNHEILGVIQEEIAEYAATIPTRTTDEEKIEELKDIAVAAIFGIATIRSSGVDG